MIFFFADDHYQTRAGARIFGNLPGDLRRRSVFFENDFSLLESGAWEPACELLVLHMIGGTCSLPHPGPGAEAAVKRYCARKGPMLLLHGSTAPAPLSGSGPGGGGSPACAGCAPKIPTA